jgi:hypothetical protein
MAGLLRSRQQGAPQQIDPLDNEELCVREDRDDRRVYGPRSTLRGGLGVDSHFASILLDSRAGLSAEAAQRCPGAIDPSWPAVFCNHSRPLEWQYGLIEDRPTRFALAWLQLIVGWGAFFALGMRLKRYR